MCDDDKKLPPKPMTTGSTHNTSLQRSTIQHPNSARQENMVPNPFAAIPTAAHTTMQANDDRRLDVARLPATGNNDGSLEGRGLTFPFRLHKMLEDAPNCGFESTVSWLPGGKSFKVHDTKMFEKAIMKRYFNQTRYKSFLRQLNLYGFTRTSTGVEKGTYMHEFFLRGRVCLCAFIRRVSSQNQDDWLKNLILSGPKDSIFDLRAGGPSTSTGGATAPQRDDGAKQNDQITKEIKPDVRVTNQMAPAASQFERNAERGSSDVFETDMGRHDNSRGHGEIFSTVGANDLLVGLEEHNALSMSFQDMDPWHVTPAGIEPVELQRGFRGQNLPSPDPVEILMSRTDSISPDCADDIISLFQQNQQSRTRQQHEQQFQRKHHS